MMKLPRVYLAMNCPLSEIMSLVRSSEKVRILGILKGSLEQDHLEKYILLTIS